MELSSLRERDANATQRDSAVAVDEWGRRLVTVARWPRVSRRVTVVARWRGGAERPASHGHSRGDGHTEGNHSRVAWGDTVEALTMNSEGRIWGAATLRLLHSTVAAVTGWREMLTMGVK